MACITWSLALLAGASLGRAGDIHWVRKSTTTGDLPPPNAGDQQTCLVVADFDRDGIADFVIGERTRTPSVVWYKWNGQGWDRRIIDNTPLRPEAGGESCDVDGDGDLDLILGQDASGNALWWWENPFPDFSKPWPRHTIKNSGGNKHHDQSVADYDNDGQAELVTWNQGAKQLLLYKIPRDPKLTEAWKPIVIYSWQDGQELEGFSSRPTDIDGDGQVDIVGGGRWFKHKGGAEFEATVIDDTMRFTQCAAGQLVKGGWAEIVFSPGDMDGEAKWYEWKNGQWVAHTLRHVIHGHTCEVGDIDGDGNLDILIGEMGSPGAGDKAQTFVWFGDGLGNFRETVISAGQGIHEGRLADFDGDGRLDILMKPYHHNAPRVDVLLSRPPSPAAQPKAPNGASAPGGNRAQGRRLALDRWTYIQVDESRGGRAFGLDADDVNGDGQLDLISGRYFYRNPGGGLTGRWERSDLGLDADAVLFVDVDGDAFADVIAEAFPDVYWLEAGDRDGTSWKAVKIANVPRSAHRNGQGYALAQIIQGGRPEIVLSTGKGIYYLEIPADPSAGNWPTTLAAEEASEQGLAVGDIDGDGLIDIAAGYGHRVEPKRIAWWKNPGRQTGPWKLNVVGETTQYSADRLSVGDLNDDGRADILVTEESWQTQERVAQLFCFEQGGPRETPTWTRRSLLTAGSLNSLDVADLDGDGDLDLVTCEHKGSDKRLFVLENGGRGALTPHVIDHGKESHLGTRLFDLDGDGDLDIVSIAWDEYRFLHLWRNDAVTASGEISFRRAEIDADPPKNPWFKILGDINGDDRLDVIIGGQGGPLVWYAFPNWTKTQIADGGWNGVNGEAVDLDGDGDTDIVMGGVVCFRNPRIGGGDWTMLRIDSQRAHDIEVGDLDRDGKMDVVGRDQSAFGGAGNAIYIYRQVEATNWAKRSLVCPHGEGLKLGDLDRDGDLDIIIGGRWYENDGDPVNGAWMEHIYTTTEFDPDSTVAVADLNGDGRLDIVLAPAELAGQTNRIAWYEAPQEARRKDWTEHIIVPSVETVIHGLAVADFDRDGRVDVAYSEMHQGADPDEVCVMQNLGRGENWRKHVLSTKGSHDIVVGDIDGDGAIDIVGANWSGPYQPIEWWRNTSPAALKAK